MANPTVKIKIGNREFENAFESVNFEMSMETVANEFEFSTVDFYNDAIKEWGIVTGDEYEFLVNDEVMANGNIDQINITTTANGRQISFSGRDKTADLADCPFVIDADNSGSFKNQTRLQIIDSLCSPFELSVTYDRAIAASVNEKIESFTVEEGVPVLDLILKLCLKESILPMSIGDGTLYLGQATNTEIVEDILGDQKIEVRNISISDRERYSKYTCKGQGTGKSTLSKIKEYISLSGTAEDSVVSRYRPFLIFADDNATDKACESRAIFERNQRAASSRTVQGTIQGWTRFDNDKPWRPNILLPVEDDYLGGKKTMLLAEITFTLDSSGYRTDMMFLPKDAYSLKEAAELAKLGFDADTRAGTISASKGKTRSVFG